MDAINFAAVAHDGQKRKAGAIPYISHPFAVGLILIQYGFPEDVAIAGILHDVVEDTPHTITEIEEKFGKKIATMVAGVTHDSALPTHDERFQNYLVNLKKSDNDARAVCLADMLHNRMSYLKELENGHDIQKAFATTKEEYLDESYQKLTIIKETLDHPLIAAVEKELEKIKAFV